MNNYKFWEKYLSDLRVKLNDLLKEKDIFYIDLHMHSNNSSDSNYSLEEILECTKNLDIISVTDHDSLDFYDELYNYLKEHKIDKPLIIPGIEFTISDKVYFSQCHILEYFINPKDKDVVKNVKTNKEASYKRTKEQFKRLKYNKGFMYYVNKYNIKISYLEYINSINELPDYASLFEYLMHKLNEDNVSATDVLDKCEYYYLIDDYVDRNKTIKDRLNYLKEKYKDNNDLYNPRLLSSVVALRGVDDDMYPNYSKIGSLSVNHYGQITMDELNNKYPLVFAHPNKDKMDYVESKIKLFSGIESNTTNKNEDITRIRKIVKDNDLFITIGSDSHKPNMYLDIEKYKISKKELEKICKKN